MDWAASWKEQGCTGPGRAGGLERFRGRWTGRVRKWEEGRTRELLEQKGLQRENSWSAAEECLAWECYRMELKSGVGSSCGGL